MDYDLAEYFDTISAISISPPSFLESENLIRHPYRSSQIYNLYLKEREDYFTKRDKEIEIFEGKMECLRKGTNMRIIQENGQRHLGPPLNYFGKRPLRGTEVFVGKIPRDCMEPEIYPVFSKAGDIYQIRIMLNFNRSNRGFCFVQYFYPEHAQIAIKLLNNYEIRNGRRIGVIASVDNCRLHVSGLPKSKTAKEIFDEMDAISEGVSQVLISPIYDGNEFCPNSGYAIVEFENHRAAAMARRKMIPGNIEMFNYKVAVDWAMPDSQNSQ